MKITEAGIRDIWSTSWQQPKKRPDIESTKFLDWKIYDLGGKAIAGKKPKPKTKIGTKVLYTNPQFYQTNIFYIQHEKIHLYLRPSGGHPLHLGYSCLHPTLGFLSCRCWSRSNRKWIFSLACFLCSWQAVCLVCISSRWSASVLILHSWARHSLWSMNRPLVA